MLIHRHHKINRPYPSDTIRKESSWKEILIGYHFLSKNTLIIPTANNPTANHVLPVVPKSHPVDLQNGEEGNGIAPEEELDRGAYSFVEEDKK